MNSKQSKYKENHAYTHYNKTAKNQDKEKILKAIRKKKLFAQVLEKYLSNE